MKKTKGFTLIELLIVIVIIGILAVAVYLAVAGARNKANNANAKNSVSELQKALEIYIADRSVQPGTYLLGTPSSPVTFTDAVLVKLKDADNNSLISSLPKDAQGGPLMLKLTDAGEYVIQAKSAKWSAGEPRCFVVGAVPSPNLDAKGEPMIGSCVWTY